jgi:hypothetical protein
VKDHSKVALYTDRETGKLKDHWAFDIWRDYKERGLQVIVKLANIHLTPEKPEYGGGAWHVEGQLVCTTKPSLIWLDLSHALFRTNTFALPQYTVMIVRMSLLVV